MQPSYIANSRLLANWLLLANTRQKVSLCCPDYNPPLVGIVRAMQMSCQHPKDFVLPEQSPIICNTCFMQVGTVWGLACAVDTVHVDCKQAHLEPPWFKTDGYYQIAYAAFGGNNCAEWLTHYIVTEYLANNIKELQRLYKERKLNELSRYNTTKSTIAGFDCINSLS